MRQLSYLSLFLLIGCWDFQSLIDRSAEKVGDGGNLTDGGKVACQLPDNVREICNNGFDDNEDCLSDCDDPTCADFIDCIPNSSALIGYGSRNPKGFNCGSQTGTDIKQGLMLGNTCTGCACQAQTNWKCSSNLHWFSDNACNNQLNMGGVQSGLTAGGASAPACVATPMATNTSYYKIDTINPTCPVDSTVPGTPQNSWSNELRICSQKTPCETLSCMKDQAGAVCLAFTGDVQGCPAQFPVHSTWVTGVTDNRACNCSCAAGGGSCTFAGSEVQLTDAPNCMGGAQKTQNINNGNCTAGNLSGGNPAAMAVNFSPKPVCAAASAPSTNLAAETAAGRVSYGGTITTCCIN